MGSSAGDARLYDFGTAPWARLARPGADVELVLELAGLAEGVVVGVEGRTALLDGPAQDGAGRGVDVLYLLCGKGAGFARGVDAGGEKDLVYVDVAEAGHDGLVEKQALHARLAAEGGGQVFDREVPGERVGAEA